MNDLIKQFACEANLATIYDGTKHPNLIGKFFPTISGPTEERLAAFAALIVQECVAVADRYVKDCWCEEHVKCEHPRSKIGLKIKERFGVE